MTPETYENIRQLMEKHRIYFDGPVPQVHWPSVHRLTFTKIQHLGQTKHDDFRQRREQRAVNDPRGAHIIRRTARIVAKATRCRSESRNEAGWRLLLESEIFARFDYEISW